MAAELETERPVVPQRFAPVQFGDSRRIGSRIGFTPHLMDASRLKAALTAS
jgi:hypothetical protein